MPAGNPMGYYNQGMMPTPEEMYNEFHPTAEIELEGEPYVAPDEYLPMQEKEEIPEMSMEMIPGAAMPRTQPDPKGKKDSFKWDPHIT